MSNIGISAICRYLNLDYIGIDVEVESVNLCNRTTSFTSILSYTTSSKYIKYVLENKSVKALVLDSKCLEVLKDTDKDILRRMALILVKDPENTFYDIHEYLYKKGFYNKDSTPPVIGKKCNIHETAVISNNVIIGNNVTIGANTVINSGAVLEDDVEIGCNSVIGGHGFQAIKGYDKIIHHIGGVLIRKGAYVGNLSTVSRSVFEGYTEIGEYSKIDDHVHFSHNCKCGTHCVLTAGTVLMGSVEIGNNVWISPSSLVLNKKHIGDDSFIGSMSYINSEVSPKSLMMGIPAKCYNKK